MRIAFVSLGFPPYYSSGLDVSGARLVTALLDEGHRLTVIAGSRGALRETVIHPRVKLYRIPLDTLDWITFSFRAARLLRGLCKGESYDVVHFWDVHFAYAYHEKYVASVQHSFRQRLKSLDWGTRSLLPTASRTGYYLTAKALAEKPSLRRASGLLAGSATTREEFIKNYGLAADAVLLARHGIDTSFFDRRRPAGNMRSRFGLGKDESVILFVGFVTPRKGMDYLAQALRLIRPEPKLIIAGRWSDTARGRFLKLLGSRSDRLIELGFLPEEQMPGLYSAADVYVSSSLLEGFGLPLVESLSCQTPVVATDSGSVSEVVGPGGILVPVRDPRSLADAISRLLGDSELRRELGRQGREHVLRKFSLEITVRQTLNAYERFA